MNNHLIIGLGGTGGKIIRSFRKAVYSEFRKEEPEGVSIEYLYVDSSREFMAASDPTWKILGTSVQLGTINQCFIGGVDLNTVLNNIDDHPGIKPWIGNRDQWRDILSSINAPTILGGQKRRLGRFLFAMRVHDFRNQLTNLVSTVREKSSEAAITFHVCCGLAGGTGSGCLIDALCQIRGLYPDPNLYNIIVYALLPDETPQKNWNLGNYHANGYSALVELNSLSVGRWLPHDVSGERERVEFVDPFNGCYLFENKNENGNIVDVDVEIPNIIADFIYLKTVGIKDAGDWQRTLQYIENGENGDATPENDGNESYIVNERSKKFLSFGIKRLAIPEDEIREYLTYSFAEQAGLRFLYENWRDGEGFCKESKNIPFNEEVRKNETLEKWKLTDAHLCLSLGILESDLKDKNWIPIDKNWQTIIPQIKKTIRNTCEEKRKWFDELKEECKGFFETNFRRLGVREFYRIKTRDKLQIANEICTQIEHDLFDKWRTAEYSLVDIGVILEALISFAEERLNSIDDQISSLKQTQKKIEDKITSIDHEWGKIGRVREFFKSLDRLFDQQATFHQELYTYRTWIEAWRFAKALLPELITKLEELRSTVDRCSSTIRQGLEKVENHMKERCSDTEPENRQISKHLVRFYQPQMVKRLSQKFRLNSDIQRLQTSGVRRVLIEKLGVSPTFKKMQERISTQVFFDLLSKECQASSRMQHDANFAADASQKLLGVSIIDKLYDRFSSNQEELRNFLSKLVRSAGNYLTLSNTEKQRRAPGVPDVVTCLKGFTAIIPSSQKYADFLKEVKISITRSLPEGLQIIETDSRRNEMTLVSITNLFPIRFIKSLDFLKKKYNKRIGSSESSRTLLELYLEGDGTRHPSLHLLSKRETEDKAIPYFMLARHMGYIIDTKDKSTNQPQMVFVSKGKDGIPNPGIALGLNIEEVIENLDVRTLNVIRNYVDSQITSGDFAELDRKIEIRERIVSYMDDLQKKFEPITGTYKRLAKGARQAIKILGVES